MLQSPNVMLMRQYQELFSARIIQIAMDVELPIPQVFI
jgi:hypothetical protein